MSAAELTPGSLLTGESGEQMLFERIASDLQSKGYSICPAALPPALTMQLVELNNLTHPDEYSGAGIGRGENHLQNEFVRTDEICWLTGETPPGAAWLGWAGRLQQYLNRRLFLGLFSFESHLAHYAPGDFYKRHYDAFRGETNRVLSLVVYLNPGWGPDEGGELLLYPDASAKQGISVQPLLGTLVAFLSEEFPHEVLPAKRHRYSIAGWFRVNASTGERVDPPR